ncbi:hypothetical protein I3843_16G038000 [Carya illinoinensis]|nr:hypothetical protein I3843_16G038000 [Carya illinoinensis]
MYSMKKRSTTTSMKSSLLVLGMTILVISAQFSVGECRALRNTTGDTAMAACEDVHGAESVGMGSFVVSSKNSSSTSSTRPPLMRSLGTRFTSGPSKKGPGH